MCSKAGKKIATKGPASFMKAASESYRSLGPQEKALLHCATEEPTDAGHTGEVKKQAKECFTKIEALVSSSSTMLSIDIGFHHANRCDGNCQQMYWDRVPTLLVDWHRSQQGSNGCIEMGFQHCLYIHEQLFLLSIQFEKLEKLNYRCLAFGFFEDDVQVVTTSDCSSCVSARCLEYLHALTVVGTSTHIVHESCSLNLLCPSQPTTCTLDSL